MGRVGNVSVHCENLGCALFVMRNAARSGEMSTFLVLFKRDGKARRLDIPQGHSGSMKIRRDTNPSWSSYRVFTQEFMRLFTRLQVV